MPNQANNYGGMTDTQIVNLIQEWGRIAPNEPNGYDARIAEAQWETSHIQGFWSPDFDEGTLFEDSYQAHCKSYIIWK